MSLTPRKDWKRYDPEPEPRDEFDPIVIVLWVVALFLAAVIAANWLSIHVSHATA